MRFTAWKNEMYRTSTQHIKTIEVGGELVTYSDIGQGNPVILFHGSFGGFDCGPCFFQEIADEGFRIITPSRPGFMMTALEHGTSPAEQADFFARFMDAIGIQKAALFAHSGGTPSALYFAHKYPSRTACITILTPVGHAQNFAPIPLLQRLLYNDFVMYCSYLISKTFPRFYTRILCKSINIDPSYILGSEERMRNMQLAFGTAAPTRYRYTGLMNDVRAFRTLSLDFLTSIHNRTQLLYSESDKRVPVSHGDHLAENIPNIEVHKFERGGHNPVMGSQGAEIVDIISAFLRSC